jgi:hypothetical protein
VWRAYALYWQRVQAHTVAAARDVLHLAHEAPALLQTGRATNRATNALKHCAQLVANVISTLNGESTARELKLKSGKSLQTLERNETEQNETPPKAARKLTGNKDY